MKLQKCKTTFTESCIQIMQRRATAKSGNIRRAIRRRGRCEYIVGDLHHTPERITGAFNSEECGIDGQKIRLCSDSSIPFRVSDCRERN